MTLCSKEKREMLHAIWSNVESFDDGLTRERDVFPLKIDLKKNWLDDVMAKLSVTINNKIKPKESQLELFATKGE